MRRIKFSGIWRYKQKIKSSDNYQKKKKKRKKKEKLPYRRFYCLGRPQIENQRKQKERQVLEPCLRNKKAVENESVGDTSCNWRTCNSPQSLIKETGRVGNLLSNRDIPNYNILEID